jgi:hypothetical protein
VNTAFAGQFEDSPSGFSREDRARIVGGKHAGKFGTIVGELVNGYYHVKVDGTGEDAVLETFELEPLIRPVLVAGGLVRAETVKATDVAEEIVDTLTRLAKDVTVPPGQVFDRSARDNLTDLLVELDEVIIEAVSSQIKIRRAVADLAARGLA